MTIDASAQGYDALADLPIRTWRGQCVPERHGSSDFWDIQARTQYGAAVQLRSQLRGQGVVMPADLDWAVVP
jgi:hypothetical protein